MKKFTEKMLKKHLRRIKNIKWLGRLFLAIFVLSMITACSSGTTEVQEMGLTDNTFIIVILVCFSLMILMPVIAFTDNRISNYCYYKHEELKLPYKYLKNNDFIYLGYELLEEDTIVVNYTYRDFLYQTKFQFYDYLGFDKEDKNTSIWEEVYKRMTDELLMHKACMKQVVIVLEEKHDEVFENENEKFKRKVKNLWR